MNVMLPVLLVLKSPNVVVVGGGRVGARGTAARGVRRIVAARAGRMDESVRCGTARVARRAYADGVAATRAPEGAERALRGQIPKPQAQTPNPNEGDSCAGGCGAG